MCHKKVAAIGSSVLLFITNLTVVGCTPGQMGYREPEIAVNDLLSAQVEALPDGWTFEPVQTRDIWTKDITSARWAVWTAFIPKDPKLRGRKIMLSEEVHVFSNAFNAQVPLFEPMRALELEKKQPLDSWNYRPPTADSYRYGCQTTEERGIEWKYCAILLRYAEYVIYLEVPVGDFYTVSDMERLLQTTDAWMADFLRKSTLQPGTRDVPGNLD